MKNHWRNWLRVWCRLFTFPKGLCECWMETGLQMVEAGGRGLGTLIRELFWKIEADGSLKQRGGNGEEAWDSQCCVFK